MNIVHIAGHLGNDPETRITKTGKKVTTLRVAARVRKGGNNDVTIWWQVSCWGDQFDSMIKFLNKGSAILVIGELDKPEIYTDREGKQQVSMNIRALNLMFSPFGKPAEKTAAVDNNIGESFAAFSTGAQKEVVAEDEIPF